MSQNKIKEDCEAYYAKPHRYNVMWEKDSAGRYFKRCLECGAPISPSLTTLAALEAME